MKCQVGLSKLGKDHTIKVNDPLQNNYLVTFHNFQEQIDIAKKKNESVSPYVSSYPFQYAELKLLNSKYQKVSNQKFKGLPRIIETILIQVLDKPIYHFNVIDQDDMQLLKSNYGLQIMNRLQVAQLLESQKEPLPKSSIKTNEIPFNGFDIEVINIEKSQTNDPTLAWYSMGEIIGEDGWGMTALPFTPMKITDFNKSVIEMNYSDNMISTIQSELSDSLSILRMDWDIYSQECVLFVERQNDFSGIWVSRIY